MGNGDTERRRLLLLTAAAVAAELFLLPQIMFELVVVSSQWAVAMQLLILCLPRFGVMLALVGLFGPFRKGRWFGAFLAAYIMLLLLNFYQIEAYVNWSSGIAASQATLPYVAGVVGALLALSFGRKEQTNKLSVPG